MQAAKTKFACLVCKTRREYKAYCSLNPSTKKCRGKGNKRKKLVTYTEKEGHIDDTYMSFISHHLANEVSNGSGRSSKWFVDSGPKADMSNDTSLFGKL